MKNVFRISLFILLISVFVIDLNGQSKEFGNVYISVKNGDTWGGLTKMKASVNLEKLGKGDDYPIVISLKENDITYFVSCSFEAKTADGRSFHKLKEIGSGWGSNGWKSPTGSDQINWVYLNKSIHEIYDGDPKPFDLELQFADGSAVKYFISPAY